ncbi:hypothetical protein JTB14_010703 [Gonioctena quinquepunctata]|nr:hypothetical protein JTB14_010703 [Gonioctena quinquepunctata]
MLSTIQTPNVENILFLPGTNIGVDESTVAFKKRIMYSSKKPTAWDLRVYAPADCATGFISVLLPYSGVSTTRGLIRPELIFTSRITLHLCNMLSATSNGSGFQL